MGITQSNRKSSYLLEVPTLLMSRHYYRILLSLYQVKFVYEYLYLVPMISCEKLFNFIEHIQDICIIISDNIILYELDI